MKKFFTIILLTILMVLSGSSCRQKSTVVQSPNQPWAAALLTTYASRFDCFWRAINSHYVFWDVDPTDWDSVYKKYMPMFEELDKKISAASAAEREAALNESFLSAVFYYMSLTSTLIDHHMYLTVFDPYRSNIKKVIFPRERDIQSRYYYHPRVATVTLESGVTPYAWTEESEIVRYFGEGGAGSTADGYKTVANLAKADEIAVKYFEKYNPVTGEGIAAADDIVSDYCISYDFTIGKNSDDKRSSTSGRDMHVIYLAMSKFSVSSWVEAYTDSPEVCPSGIDESFAWKAGKTLVTFFTTIRQHYDSKDLAGIILDNRGNSGGDSEDFSYLIGLYTDKPLTILFSKSKEGFGKTDYSAEIPGISYPNTAKSDYYCDLVSSDIPYVVLVDLNSCSCGEVTAAGISSMKNGYVIGERTLGGTGGILLDPAMLTTTYGGTFGDEEKGPIFVASAAWNTRLYTRDGYKSLEGIGVTPDKEVYYKSTGEGNLAADVQTMLKSQVREAFSYIAAY